MHCRILWCFPAPPADLKRSRRVNVFQVSTTKGSTRPNSASRSDRLSKRLNSTETISLGAVVFPWEFREDFGRPV